MKIKSDMEIVLHSQRHNGFCRTHLTDPVASWRQWTKGMSAALVHYVKNSSDILRMHRLDSSTSMPTLSKFWSWIWPIVASTIDDVLGPIAVTDTSTTIRVRIETLKDVIRHCSPQRSKEAQLLSWVPWTCGGQNKNKDEEFTMKKKEVRVWRFSSQNILDLLFQYSHFNTSFPG